MLAKWTRGVTRDEWLRLSGFGAAVLALHIVGWGLFLYYSGHYRPLVGLGLTAYLFGLRHAFDADHIAAIDNTTRKLLQDGKRPLGVGFFFSLGHSSVVMWPAVMRVWWRQTHRFGQTDFGRGGFSAPCAGVRSL